MLENAGAVVFTPRERDWQKHEVIADNDNNPDENNYIESTGKHAWTTTNEKGFACHLGEYHDSENPFDDGTARMSKTVKSREVQSTISYQPEIPEDGRYAVYVSYQTLRNSIDDAEYTVWHKGIPTTFKVNQRMGGGTWVYLGTFEFARGNSIANRVVLSNVSKHNGIVTADAVRIGGGMGNIVRCGTTSGLPRCLEGARYYAQWSGMPDSVYTELEDETNDYKDDINVRSKMTNYVGGGSCYIPNYTGLKVPLELSLGVHSDAGFSKNGDSLTATLTICTTKYNEGLLNAGISRKSSFELAHNLLMEVTRDLKTKCGDWYYRGILDRNYSESRRPEIPSAIIETLSHQNFLDMKLAQDPNFKFTLARAIYKTILRFTATQHNTNYCVTPLAPDNFRMEYANDGNLRLSWDEVTDSLEPSATPTGYVVYTSVGNNGFDNGQLIPNSTSCVVKVTPGLIHSFKITAVNDGGESFPTETLSTVYHPDADHTILVVNGFHRLSSPAIVTRDSLQGFDFDEDPGVSFGPTYGWVGRQIVFEQGLTDDYLEYFSGWSNDDFSGKLIAGNDLNYTYTHTEAIHASNNKYNVVSCSSHYIDYGGIEAENYISNYPLIDLILGLEYNDGRSLHSYKAFSPAMQSTLSNFTKRGGSLLITGAYIGTDLTSDSISCSDGNTQTSNTFLSDILKCKYSGRYRQANNTIKGMGTTMKFHNALNSKHYAAVSADILQPTKESFAMLLYANGYSAGVAYKGDDYHSITLGFPFECITDKQKRADIMGGILTFLLK